MWGPVAGGGVAKSLGKLTLAPPPWPRLPPQGDTLITQFTVLLFFLAKTGAAVHFSTSGQVWLALVHSHVCILNVGNVRCPGHLSPPWFLPATFPLGVLALFWSAHWNGPSNLLRPQMSLKLMQLLTSWLRLIACSWCLNASYVPACSLSALIASQDTKTFPRTTFISSELFLFFGCLQSNVLCSYDALWRLFTFFVGS